MYIAVQRYHKLKKAIHKTCSVMFLCNTGGRHGFHFLLMFLAYKLKKVLPFLYSLHIW